ncbi:uncharacterized protein BXZ73DRAFT_53544 [Epithele typhae]|uniref:uncharacterized protein n=1 Tax=Epithele typhae TaxID=378194 RepID=UPI0020085C6C|nr:uncharacterized protein BXZ73DRAFT_53544 [Epithele typhae]KAH9916955.1 hypothetical protein BXZ73DRAFT_53544 [Epithele typhae]
MFLTPNEANGNLPWLQWDIRLPSRLAQRRNHYAQTKRLCSKYRKQPATVPGLSWVKISYNATIVSAFSNRWGDILVEKPASAEAVTMGDVLDAIYDFFHQQVRHEEMLDFRSSVPEAWAAAEKAFYQRCDQSPGITQVEVSGGMRRVDCLGERHTFWGMWVMHTCERNVVTPWLNLGLMPDLPPGQFTSMGWE